jgi:hypothetical protein
MRKPLAVLLLIGWTFLSQTPSVAAQVRPRIRAVTAFIEIDQNNYAAKIAVVKDESWRLEPVLGKRIAS